MTGTDRSDLCQMPHCRQDLQVICLGKGMCYRHWNEHCMITGTKELRFNWQDITKGDQEHGLNGKVGPWVPPQ